MIYLRETPQNGGREPTLFKFIEAVHNCLAVWNVLSLAYKDTNKNKQNKTEEHADKPFYFSTAFRFFFSSVSLLYVNATTLKKRSCCKLPCLLFDTSLTCEGKSLSLTFQSFPTRVCQLKFAVWRPLNIQINNLTKNEKCKPEIRNEVSFFSPSPSPPPQLSLIGIFHFCSPPSTKWWQINENRHYLYL